MVGVTTNPTIFATALAKGEAYDAQVGRTGRRGAPTSTRRSSRSPPRTSARRCDIFRPIYEATGGLDGRVSIEVDPRLAHDTDGDDRAGRRTLGHGRPAERDDQDPGHRRGPARHLADARRGHQRQRDADLLPRPLPRGHERLPDRARAGPGRRPGPLDDPLGRLVLRQPGRHRDRQAARTRSAPTRPRRSRARPASPTPGSPTRPSRRSSASARWQELAAAGANRAAPAVGLDRGQGPGLPGHPVRHRAGRARTPSTPCPEKTLEAVADHGVIAGDTVTGHYDEPRTPFSTRSTPRASPTPR